MTLKRSVTGIFRNSDQPRNQYRSHSQFVMVSLLFLRTWAIVQNSSPVSRSALSFLERAIDLPLIWEEDGREETREGGRESTTLSIGMPTLYLDVCKQGMAREILHCSGEISPPLNRTCNGPKRGGSSLEAQTKGKPQKMTNTHTHELRAHLGLKEKAQ